MPADWVRSNLVFFALGWSRFSYAWLSSVPGSILGFLTVLGLLIDFLAVEKTSEEMALIMSRPISFSKESLN